MVKPFVGNQSPLPLIDLKSQSAWAALCWESVTSPFDRLNIERLVEDELLGISHLSL